MAAAQSYYRWIDADGRVHFSDRAPQSSAAMPETLAVPRYAAPEVSPGEAIYSIRNQLQRIEESRARQAREYQQRRQSEREYQLRMREIEALEQAQAAPPVSPSPVVIIPRRHHPAHVPDHRPQYPEYRPPFGLWKPDHPAFRPYAQTRPAFPGRGQGVDGVVDIPR